MNDLGKSFQPLWLNLGLACAVEQEVAQDDLQTDRHTREDSHADLIYKSSLQRNKFQLITPKEFIPSLTLCNSRMCADVSFARPHRWWWMKTPPQPSVIWRNPHTPCTGKQTSNSIQAEWWVVHKLKYSQSYEFWIRFVASLEFVALAAGNVSDQVGFGVAPKLNQRLSICRCHWDLHGNLIY